ncbi:MAG: type I DNA topoisomerase [Erysipelotrichaceae bacterium]|nr:type I DNA topoisomerase [Erysipelotrichaceae bacterium]
MKLVIVESPTKCHTIQRYLGDGYIVKASLGHIRDLATSGKGGLGIDVENDFAPTYKINKDKIGVVNELKSLSRKAEEVILATDPDREGEAIAWHLATVLGLDPHQNKRLEFHEITRESITNALNSPRTIDLNLVSSQETRRIIDRIIGFKLSTLLNSKIHSKSAGRVQSATLKLIYDHDKEIKNFVPEEYWVFSTKAKYKNAEFVLSFKGDKKGKVEVNNKEKADQIINSLGDTFKVIEVKKTVKHIESKEPFTTSTLQQEAFNKLKFKTKKTQFLAQTLYEGVLINGEHVGLITYIRTDSSRLSGPYVARANAFIEETYGKEYLGRVRGNQHNILSQDAHEAIRPTSNHLTPESVRRFLKPDQYSLYKLIYNRTLASLMKPKKVEVEEILLENNGYIFSLEFTKTLFPGFELVYKDDDSDYKGSIPSVNEGEEFTLIEKKAEQKFTQPPAAYSEARLVKLMEEVGIGRPSTYSSTIETLKKRGYVDNESGILNINDQGIKTTVVLNKYFPDIVDAKYTAQMETNLDDVQDGSASRIKMLTDFYVPFNEEVERAKKLMYPDEGQQTGELCPQCGSPLVSKHGKNGTFIGCSNFPKCKYVKKEKVEVQYVGRNCPQCGSPLVIRRDKKGKEFVACSSFPKCKYIEKEKIEYTQDDFVKKCPKCDGFLVKKRGKRGYFLGCNNYPNCDYMESYPHRHRSHSSNNNNRDQ